MSHRQKMSNLIEARALYLRGLSTEEIASALSVVSSTVRRWREADARGGADWETMRRQHPRRDLRSVLVLLDDRLAALLSDETKDISAVADAAAKLSQVAEHLRDRLGDPDKILDVFKELSEWAAKHLSDDSLTQLREVLDAFLLFVREGCSR